MVWFFCIYIIYIVLLLQFFFVIHLGYSLFMLLRWEADNVAFSCFLVTQPFHSTICPATSAIPPHRTHRAPPAHASADIITLYASQQRFHASK
jgi:hypothetical protein